MSSEIYEQSRSLINEAKISHRHTFFQLKHFVLGKELTTQGKLQKCVKELEARVEAMESIELSIEEAQDDMELLGLKIEALQIKKKKNELPGCLHRKYKDIQIRKLNRKKKLLLNSLGNLKNKYKEAEEEAAFFLGAFKQLEVIEPLRDYDDAESNQRFWNENFGQELKLRLLLQKPLDVELVKSVLALNKESPIRIEMVKMLDQIQDKIIEDKIALENRG
jgi:hypothetical protein